MKKKIIVSRVIGILTALSFGVLTILPGREIISDSSVSGSPIRIYDVMGDSDDSPLPPCPIDISLY